MDEKSTLPKKWEHLKCGNDFSRCMLCGGHLIPAVRKQPEACEDCVNHGLNLQVKDGKVVEIPGGYGNPWIEKVNNEKAEEMMNRR